MSSSASDRLRLFEAALADPSEWVRMGAIREIAERFPADMPAVLRRATRTPSTIHELAVVAWAYEMSGIRYVDELARALEVDAEVFSSLFDIDHWDDFVLTGREMPQLRAIGSVAARIWQARRYWRFSADAPPPEDTPDNYEYAARATENTVALAAGYTGREAMKTDGEKLFGSIRARLRSEDPVRREEALRELAGIAMTEVNGWFRDAAASALSYAGLEGAQFLLPSLFGDPVATPSPEQFAALAAEGMLYEASEEDAAKESVRRNAAAYLSGVALQEFSDEGTLSAIVDVALTAPLVVRTRAELILAAMGIDVSLPYLFHAAVSRTEWEESQRAEAILDGIVSKRSDYAIHYHHVGATTRIDTSLQWLIDLLHRYREIPPAVAASTRFAWAFDRTAAVAILGSALRTVPLVAGEIRIDYMDQTPYDRFVGFTNRILGLSFRKKPVSPATIVRHPELQFPSQCVMQEPAPLTVQLKIAPTGSTHEPVTLPVNADKEIDLLVIVHAPAFTIEPRHYQRLLVPVDDSSQKIEFKLTPKQLGPQTVEVDLVRGADRVGYYYLTTEVVRERNAAKSVEALVVDTPANRDLLRRGVTRAVIFADWQTGGPVSFELVDPYGMGVGEPVSIGKSQKSISTPEVQEWVKKQTAVIESFVIENFETQEELESAIAGLTAIGFSLFSEIGCPELEETLNQFPNGSIIAIESNDWWIPWELLSSSPGGPMLGERFQIIRIPRFGTMEKSVELSPASVPAMTGATHVEQILAVIGDRIPRGASSGGYDSEATFRAKAPAVQELIEGTSNALTQKITSADVVHFTCHGLSEPTYHLSLGEGKGKRFFVEQVRQLPLKPGAIVFVNACSSDRARLLLTTFETLGRNFFLQGARPFIGTLGPVPQKHAIAMAKAFYRYFFIEGLPAGAALQSARTETMKEFSSPFSLFYCMYGPASVSRRLARRW